jgi:hypothetical protein
LTVPTQTGSFRSLMPSGILLYSMASDSFTESNCCGIAAWRIAKLVTGAIHAADTPWSRIFIPSSDGRAAA